MSGCTDVCAVLVHRLSGSVQVVIWFWLNSDQNDAIGRVSQFEDIHVHVYTYIVYMCFYFSSSIHSSYTSYSSLNRGSSETTATADSSIPCQSENYTIESRELFSAAATSRNSAVDSVARASDS